MLRAHTVLVGVVDERASQALYRHLANREDVILRTLRCMEDILLEVIDRRADVLVLDLELPGSGSGRSVEVLRRADPSLEIVVLSPNDDLERGRQILRHRIFYYGITPVPETELLAAVDQALAHQAERSETRG